MSEILELSAREAGERIRDGELAAEECFAAWVGAAADDDLNAYLWRAGEDGERATHPPLAVKDIFCTAGVPTTAGSRILEGYEPPYTSTAVRNLGEAGVGVLGKTNMDEFAMGSSNENSGYGPVLNPWDRERVPGGSSGGSAAAVAGGLAPWAIGTDTGGSIRQPASLCGIVGMKPTYGAVSRYGMIAFASSLDQCGPLTRDVTDAAILLRHLQGRNPCDSTSLGIPGEIPLPSAKHGIAAYYVIAPAEASANLARYDGVRYGPRASGNGDLTSLYEQTREEGFGPEVKRRIMIGTYALSSGYYEAYYGTAQKVRTKIAQDFSAAFEKVDFVVSPTSATVAFKLGERTADPLAMYLSDHYTVPMPLAGIPAISIPCGLSEGLPVGFQIAGPAFSEARILDAAHALEKLIGFEGVPVG